jgi:hypothetical protein
LDAIVGATLYATASARPGVPASFTTYDDGRRIEVYFTDGTTDIVSKAEVEFPNHYRGIIPSTLVYR